MKPFLSIVTPLHNKGLYISETIQSVLGQSLTDWEMVVVENYSTDNGPEVVEEYSARDQRIRLFHAPIEVHGPGAARNFGLRHTTGEWVVFLDADDVILPGHFETVAQQASRFPDADLITCDWLQGPELMNGRCELKKPTNCNPDSDFISSAVAFCPWVPHAAMVKRKALRDPPWWDESFDQLVAEDYPFWFKVLLGSRPVYSSHTGVFYRDETAGRRNDTTNLRRYLDSLDKAVQANLDLLSQKQMALNFCHRKALLNLHLGLLRFSFSKEETELKSRIKRRIRELRPAFSDACKQRDLTPALSYLMPFDLLRRLQEWRRGLTR